MVIRQLLLLVLLRLGPPLSTDVPRAEQRPNPRSSEAPRGRQEAAAASAAAVGVAGIVVVAAATAATTTIPAADAAVNAVTDDIGGQDVQLKPYGSPVCLYTRVRRRQLRPSSGSTEVLPRFRGPKR